MYTKFCNAQTQSETEYAFKHWRIQSEFEETVILRENRNKISQGTTGLNVWESALVLSEWAIQNKDAFYGKNIVELGAGTGLSSFIIAKCCTPITITITDGNEKVLEILNENASNNFQKMENNKFCHSSGTIVGNDT